MDRYSRQIRFEPIGEAGQRRLGAARVTLIGCGALGSVIADCAVRAGVGFIRIVDRDYLELNNLQRQVLFDEHDVAAHLPKAEAARRKLANINSQVELQALTEDANHSNIETLVDGADLILDGTDNFETRYLINEVACKQRKPWIYGACVSASGLVMPIIPGDTPCLKCLFEEAPPPEMTPSCDTAGVLGSLVHVVAGLQATEALKILSGNSDAITRRLINIDLWSGRIVSLDVGSPRTDEPCPCCQQAQYEYLDGHTGQSIISLCGRDAVQISPPPGQRPNMEALGHKLMALGTGETIQNEYMLQVHIDKYQITVFPTGRTIIKGTTHPDEARSVHARYIGS